MSKVRTRFFHASCASTALAAALLLTAWGCGKTTTIGQVVPEPDGGASGNGGSTAGPADGAVGSGNSAGGASEEAGSGAETGTKTACGVPRPAPKPNPTAAEQERAGLIRSLCERLLEIGCLYVFDDSVGQISQEAKDCPPDEQIAACELDLLYSDMRSVNPACDAEWHAMIRCEIAAENDAERCYGLDPSDPYGEPAVSQLARCGRERKALALCSAAHVNTEVITGKRARCAVGSGSFDPAICYVSCLVDAASGTEKNYFNTECSAPAGLPLFCYCYVNGNIIHKGVPNRFDPFSASSCREVGQMMADGECVDRLDCCVQWPASDGGQNCRCMASDQIGASSCEAAAQAAGGTVVDICPQYKPRDDISTCWPPWDINCQPQP